jgi:hypothetical protein
VPQVRAFFLRANLGNPHKKCRGLAVPAQLAGCPDKNGGCQSAILTSLIGMQRDQL